jgi:hypothetical protein
MKNKQKPHHKEEGKKEEAKNVHPQEQATAPKEHSVHTATHASHEKAKHAIIEQAVQNKTDILERSP